MMRKIELDKLSKNTSIWLEENFRRQLIEEGIKKAGSMRQLGRVMGYTGNAPNWSIKQIIKGKQGVPLHRLKRLCEFIGATLEEIKDKIEKI